MRMQTKWQHYLRLLTFLTFSIILLGLLTCKSYGQTKLRVQPLTSSVWVHTSFKLLNDKPFPSNGLIIEGDSSVLIIDTAWDSLQTTQLIHWVDSALHKPISGVIASHWHDDRLGGTSGLQNASIPLYTSTLTKNFAWQAGDSVKANTFTSDTTFYLEAKAIEVSWPGAGHTKDNLVIWLPHEKVLYGGCLVKSQQATNMGNTKDADLKQWPATISHLLHKYKQARWLIPGHQQWNRAGTPATDLLQHTLKLLQQAHQKKN